MGRVENWHLAGAAFELFDARIYLELTHPLIVSLSFVIITSFGNARFLLMLFNVLCSTFKVTNKPASEQAYKPVSLQDVTTFTRQRVEIAGK